jgi:hypothetical protein
MKLGDQIGGMKVIYQGSLPEPRKFSGTCQRCHTKIEAWGTSVYRQVNRIEPNDDWFARCPTCNDQMRVHDVGN